MNRKSFITAFFYILFLILAKSNCDAQISTATAQRIDLSGTWAFALDSSDRGIAEKWFSKKLSGKIALPGSLAGNGIGDEIRINTPWTGEIQDSSYFFAPQWAPYRRPGNIKIPFWLQPLKYYKGAAWFQKTIVIPPSWEHRFKTLFIERSHWETTAWLDGVPLGMQNSLATPHLFAIPQKLPPGTYTLSIRVDNRIKDIDVGKNSHSVTDHTQSNWNGVVGKLFLSTRPLVFMDDIRVYPDAEKNIVKLRFRIRNFSGGALNTRLALQVNAKDFKEKEGKTLVQDVLVQKDSTVLELVYPMSQKALYWDEFSPNLYQIRLQLGDGNTADVRQLTFGFRELSVKGAQLFINGRPLFLRGTLECAVFPKTGYPPTDKKSWEDVFIVCKKYGLNHIRFHSWCPPEAAFEAADALGLYLHVECSSWANSGTSIGDGKPIDQYIFDESRAIVDAYGNHPSFCMMAYGNEPAGGRQQSFLGNWVRYWKEKDPRRLYTSAAGWPLIPENDFHSSPDPRIQAWGAGLSSIINAQPPSADFDWRGIIQKWKQPVVSHEIGQWCVYPDFKEIAAYTGVLKARNFEIFRDFLQTHGMAPLADSFLLASGKLQTLCYKADIEAALRTPGFGGFQLLGLNDFPGQGTALVGVVNAFWKDKGYVTGGEFSRFCNAVVPLARLPKMIYENNETLQAPVQIANFGPSVLKNAVTWNIRNIDGAVLYRGSFAKTTIPMGNDFIAGTIQQSFATVQAPQRLILTVAVGKYENSWDLFVYPVTKDKSSGNVLVTAQFNREAIGVLRKGGKVLLSLPQGSVKEDKGGNVKTGFSSIFWNTAWTHGQAPHTLGILCNPAHPALQYFPTQYHSNYQWQYAMSHCNAIRLDSLSPRLQPIVRIIDDWFTARPLAMIFECKVGQGKLLVSGADLFTHSEDRPEARQLLYSLQKYMEGNQFNPAVALRVEKIQSIIK